MNIINVTKRDSNVAKIFFYNVFVVVVVEFGVTNINIKSLSYVAFCVKYFYVSTNVSFARNNRRCRFSNPSKSYYIIAVNDCTVLSNGRLIKDIVKVIV